MRLRVLLEPDDERLRRRFRETLEFIEKVFKPEYLEGLKVIGAQPHQADRVFSTILVEGRLAEEAVNSMRIVKNPYGGGVFNRVSRIVVLAASGIADLQIAFHEFIHAVTFPDLVGEFNDMLKDDYRELNDLFMFCQAFADRRWVDLFGHAVMYLLGEYLAAFGQVTYLKWRRKEPVRDLSVEILHHLGESIMYVSRDIHRAVEEAYKAVPRRRVGRRVLEALEKATRYEYIVALVDSIFSNAYLVDKAHAVLSKAIQRYPADLFEEYRHLWIPMEIGGAPGQAAHEAVRGRLEEVVEAIKAAKPEVIVD